MKLVPVLVLLLLGGCMPDLKSDLPPDRIYWLEVSEVADSAPVRIDLAVVPGLDSDRIWLLQRDQRLNYYAGAYWPENLGLLLESLLGRSLNSQRSGQEIHVLIERFFAVETGEGLAPEVELQARFAGPSADCRFRAVETLADNRLRDVVAGHQQVLDRLAAALGQFSRTGRCP